MNDVERILGFVKLIVESTTPPETASAVWWDESLDSPIHKVFNTNRGEWVPLGTDAQFVTLDPGSGTQGDNINIDITGLNSFRLILDDDINTFQISGTPIVNEPIIITIVSDQDRRSFTLGDQFDSNTSYDNGALVQLYFDDNPREPSTNSQLRNTALYAANADGISGAFTSSEWDLYLIIDNGIAPQLHTNSNFDTNYILRRVIDQDNTDSQHWIMKFDPDNIT